MKLHLLLGALLCSHVYAAGEGFTNFVRQTQQGTGVVWNMPVTPEGSSASQLLLEEGGSLFQLWTIEQTTVKEYLLDQKLVGAYLPKADIVITSVDPTKDPVSGAPRTRADKGFTVKTTVSGLVTAGTNLPTAATKVLFEQHLANFTGATTSITPAQATSGTPKSSAYLTSNNATTLNFGATSLAAVNGDPAKAKGQEHFVVHALSDGSYSQTQIASKYIQIWPAATGSITGIANGAKIRSKAPALTVQMNDLYPSSSTYLQIYEGTEKLGTKGTKLTDKGMTVLDGSVSVTKPPLTIDNYDSYFTKDGTYTMELVTETPFDAVRLTWVTFTVDRTLEIRGQVTSLE